MAATKHVGIDNRSVAAASPKALLMTPEDAWATFDEAAQFYLGMSGEEFLRALDAGEFDNDPERPEVVSVAMLRPGGR